MAVSHLEPQTEPLWQLHDFEGEVIMPGELEYDHARTVFYGGIDRWPAAILRPVDDLDVMRAVSLAREAGFELAVRSGGHSVAGHGVSDGGIVLDLSGMRALSIDFERGTAWAETGISAGAYTAAVGAHGLATPLGDTGSVGLGGITLGGGVGYLARKHGLTIDSLIAADVVTADGELLTADAEHHPDLFWALRGGGGNFGVATRFHLRLHRVEPFVGGMLVLPATPNVVSAFVEEAAGAPEELTTIANVMPAPPLPFLPEEQHGRPVVMATLAFAGPEDRAERAIAPFRSLARPLADLVRPIAYPEELFRPEQEDFHPIAAMRTQFADSFGGAAAEAVLEHLREGTAPMRAVQLRVLGGAADRVPGDATAYAHRGRRLMVNVAAMYHRRSEADVHEAWAAGLARELAGSGGGAYANFLGDEGEERVREAYPGATWDRLAEIKARYDPGNLFRLNQNIPPSVSRARR